MQDLRQLNEANQFKAEFSIYADLGWSLIPRKTLWGGPSWTKIDEIAAKIQFWFNKVHFKMSSVKWRPYCIGFDVLTPNVAHVTEI